MKLSTWTCKNISKYTILQELDDKLIGFVRKRKI